MTTYEQQTLLTWVNMNSARKGRIPETLLSDDIFKKACDQCYPPVLPHEYNKVTALQQVQLLTELSKTFKEDLRNRLACLIAGLDRDCCRTWNPTARIYPPVPGSKERFIFEVMVGREWMVWKTDEKPVGHVWSPGYLDAQKPQTRVRHETALPNTETTMITAQIPDPIDPPEAEKTAPVVLLPGQQWVDGKVLYVPKSYPLVDAADNEVGRSDDVIL